jgi:hypothetical protein
MVDSADVGAVRTCTDRAQAFAPMAVIAAKHNAAHILFIGIASMLRVDHARVSSGCCN